MCEYSFADRRAALEAFLRCFIVLKAVPDDLNTHEQ
jgi:hypothetical protein